MNAIKKNVKSEEDYILVSVIGVGYNGCKTVNSLYGKSIHTSFAICDAYLESLNESPVEKKVLLRQDNNIIPPQDISKMLHHSSLMNIILVNIDNNISMQAACQIGKASKELSRLTLAIVSMPSLVEYDPKKIRMQRRYEELKSHVDCIFVAESTENSTSVEEYLANLDNTLVEYAYSLIEMGTIPNLICLDINNIKFILQNSGDAVLGIGSGVRVSKAINEAINNLRHTGHAISNDKRMIVFLIYKKWGQEELKKNISDLNAFFNQYDDSVEITWGMIVDENMRENVKIEIIGCCF